MVRIKYFLSKIKRAWSTGTLWFKSRRFLLMIIRRPLEILVGYSKLSKSDRNLNVRDGFTEHRQRNSHHLPDSEHIGRIVAAYKASKKAQLQSAEAFQIKGLWEEWLFINYMELIQALEREDISTLSKLYENFFREQFTTGTGGYDNYVNYRSPLGGHYIKYVWSSYRDKLLTLDFDLRKITFPMVGNPTGVLFNDTVIPIDALRHIYHAVEMCNLLCDIPNAVILEIGGGLGGQAYQSIRLCNTLSKYLVFDIPEVASISSYFLLSAFPQKHIRLFGEGPISTASTAEYDLAIFPHFAMPQLADLSVDLCYNSCSFSEMDSASSKEYLSVIERICRKYFLHDNHDMVLQFKQADGSASVNIIGSKLLPNPALFKRIFKKPRVHSLPEDKGVVQYEYLYERMHDVEQ